MSEKNALTLLPERVNIWIAQIFPFLATPLAGSPDCRLVLKPAAIPETCVPWSQILVEPMVQLSISGLAAPAPICEPCPFGHSVLPPATLLLEKQASAITLP